MNKSSFPKYEVWMTVHKSFRQELKNRPELPEPPRFLILQGWGFSSSLEKEMRWKEICEWANQHELNHLIPELSDADYEIE